jgi:hypothetical protein
MARIITGGIVEAVGAVLVAAWAIEALPTWALWAGLAALAGGGFAIFEGLNGWCIVRAMGFKTPM